MNFMETSKIDLDEIWSMKDSKIYENNWIQTPYLAKILSIKPVRFNIQKECKNTTLQTTEIADHMD
jgi:hypothetical protein